MNITKVQASKTARIAGPITQDVMADALTRFETRCERDPRFAAKPGCGDVDGALVDAAPIGFRLAVAAGLTSPSIGARASGPASPKNRDARLLGGLARTLSRGRSMQNGVGGAPADL